LETKNLAGDLFFERQPRVACLACLMTGAVLHYT
jgi:hypothetical protein